MGKRRSARPGRVSGHPAPQARTSRLEPFLRPLWYLAAALAAWSFGYTIMRGSDLWWHLATGRWIANHHAIPRTDPWSFTAGPKRWIVDAWLSDLAYWVWSQAFGLMSLAWMKWLVMMLIAVVLLAVLVRLCGNHFSAWMAVLFAFAVAAPFIDIRPQLHSFLCFSLLLLLTVGRDRPSWLIVPLMLVWSNLHAGFTLGIIVLPVVLAPFLLERGQRRRTVLLGSLALLACLINPNGPGAFVQPILYALRPSSPFHSIGEWLPPFRPGGIQSALYPWAIAAFVVGALVLFGAREQKGRWVAIALGVMTLAMSLQSRRFVPVFALAMTLTVAPALAKLLGPLLRRIPMSISLAAATALAVALLLRFPQRSYAFHYLVAEHTFPIETMNFVETNGLHGKVFAYWNWGGYVHFRTDGALRVFVDGRASALFEDRVYLDYVRVLGGHPGWQEVVERSGAEYFLWPRERSDVTRQLLGSGRWRQIYEDAFSVLLVRADVPVPPLRPTADSAFRRLALGVTAFQRQRFDVARQELSKALEMMPWNAAACDLLARSDKMSGNVGRDPTVERCQAMFPVPDREAGPGGMAE